MGNFETRIATFHEVVMIGVSEGKTQLTPAAHNAHLVSLSGETAAHTKSSVSISGKH